MIIKSVLLGFFSVLAIGLFRKRNLMNTITVLHIFGIGMLALYTLMANDLPLFLFKNEAFFLDSLSMYEILLSSVIFLLAAIYARGYVDTLIDSGELAEKNVPFFYACFNMLFTTILFVYCSNNIALMWLAIEFSTLLSALLIVILNAKENIIAAMKYVFIVSSSMLLSFLGIILLFSLSKQFGSASLHWNVLLQQASYFPYEIFAFAFVFIFLGFAAKSGIVPFHAWLPVAYAKAPSDVSVLLSSSVANVGIYAIIRFYAIGMHSKAASFVAGLLVAFGTISILIACLSMLKRKNLKKAIAFSSIENNGLMLLGLGAGSVFWVIYHVSAHALAKSLLFFSAGIFRRQYGSSRVEYIHSPFRLQPFASIGLILGMAAIVGTPLLPLFVSKFFIVAAVGNTLWALVALIAVCLVIAAASFAWFMVQIFANAQKPMAKLAIPFSMHLPIALLLIAIIFLGLYIPESVQSFLKHIVSELGL